MAATTPFRIIYNPATPGCILVDNNTGFAKPHKQGSIIPVWNDTATTLELRYQRHDSQNLILSQIIYSQISLSTDGGTTFSVPASYAVLVAWVAANLFNIGTGSGGGGNVTIVGPLGQAASANSIPVVLSNNQSPINVLPGPLGPNNMANSLPVTMANDQVLQEGCVTGFTSNQPTISTSAYAANMSLGAVLTLSNAFRTNGGSGTLDSIKIIDYGNQAAAIDLYFFAQNPGAGTYTDHTAIVAPNATDWSYIIAQVSITSGNYKRVGISTGQYAVADVIVRELVRNTEATKNLYCLMVIQATATYPANNNIILKCNFFQD